MFLKSKILYMHVETPLHAGAGSGLGAIDLPIQRERSTGYPLIHASGIKGALRDVVREKDLNTAEIEAIFGPEPGAESRLAHAGSFSPGDARILLFPVRSLKGVFAWATSDNVLQRWAREVKPDQGESPLPEGFSAPRVTDATDAYEFCYASSNNVVTQNDLVVLEEFAYKYQENDQLAGLAGKLSQVVFPARIDDYWRELLKTNLVVLPDNAFKDFVNYATEVITRTRLEPDTKTVVRGALWTEEHLPVDTVLYSPIRASRIRMNKGDIPTALNGSPDKQAEETLKWLTEKVGDRIQLGGDETVGRGLVNLNWV